jgi:hypothetical protein
MKKKKDASHKQHSRRSRVRRRIKRALLAPSLLLPVSLAAGKPVRHTVTVSRVAVPHADSASGSALERAAAQAGLGLPVLRAALSAYRQAEVAGVVRRAVLTVIDYTLPSHMRRLWVFDLERGTVLAHEFVAHGRGSGDDIATRFSNATGSLESSLGTFVTAGTYVGAHGRSLRLEGVSPGLNDNAMQRGLVVHGAPYVSENAIRQLGRLGRSEGCPALSSTVAPLVIDMIEGGSVLFSYFPSPALMRSLAAR